MVNMQSGICCGLSALVEVCCCYSLSVMHVKRHGHRWVFFLPVVSALVALLQVELFFDRQPFQLIRKILQWPTLAFA